MRRIVTYEFEDGTQTTSYNEALNSGKPFKTFLVEETDLFHSGEDCFGRDMLEVLQANRLTINDLTCPW